MDNAEAEPRCSFCGKPQHQVAQLVAGVGVYICNECVQVALETISPPAPPRTILTLSDGQAITVTQSITESLALTHARHEFAPFTLPDGRQLGIRSSTINRLSEVFTEPAS